MRLLMKVATLLVLVGCDAATRVSHPQDQLRPRLTLDCTLSTGECNAINAGIVRLEQSADADCLYAGNMARLLFDNTSNGFHPGDSQAYPDFDMYVNMAPGGCSSGECRSDDNIYVNSTNFSVESMAGLVAHEYEHYDGSENRTHSVGIAVTRQAQCSL